MEKWIIGFRVENGTRLTRLTSTSHSLNDIYSFFGALKKTCEGKNQVILLD